MQADISNKQVLIVNVVECTNPKCSIRKLRKSNKGEDKMKRCGKCRDSFYCSEKCQREDWKSHRAVCGAPELAMKLCDQMQRCFVSNRGLLASIVNKIKSVPVSFDIVLEMHQLTACIPDELLELSMVILFRHVIDGHEEITSAWNEPGFLFPTTPHSGTRYILAEDNYMSCAVRPSHNGLHKFLKIVFMGSSSDPSILRGIGGHVESSIEIPC